MTFAADPIQWYPGHMAQAMRRLGEDLRLVDLAIEVVDARVPASGTNPALATLVGRKPSVVVLSREDLADPQATAAWLDRLRADGRIAVAVNGKRQATLVRLREAIAAVDWGGRGGATRRIVVVGIPNAGKSTIINALAKKNVARVEDRAGVTRARQWFRVGDKLEVMDTAGILVPRIADADAQWKLAIVGAVPRARFDAEAVVDRFAAWCAADPRYRSVPDLATFAQTRGFLRRGTLSDTHNAAWSYLREVGAGTFGRITLEEPS